MSRKNKKHDKRKPPVKQPKPDGPAAAVLPILWMLTVGVTALAELASVVGAVWTTQSEDMRLVMMTAAAMFSAAMGGLFVLALTVLITRTLRPPPPKSLVTTAVVVGVIPWAVLLVQLLT